MNAITYADVLAGRVLENREHSARSDGHDCDIIFRPRGWPAGRAVRAHFFFPNHRPPELTTPAHRTFVVEARTESVTRWCVLGFPAFITFSTGAQNVPKNA